MQLHGYFRSGSCFVRDGGDGIFPLSAGGVVMKRWKWCLAALAVLSLSGLQGVVSPSWGAEPIKIGLPLPLTGTQAKFGEAIRNAYMMALEEINAQGGIRKGPLKGRTIEFLLEDTQSKPDVAKEEIQWFCLSGGLFGF